MHLGIGRIAGQHCGGFTEVTLGSAPNIPLPLNTIMPFHVPVGKMAFWLKRWFSRVKVRNFHLCAKKIGEKITFQTFSHRFFPFLFGIISPFSPYFSKEQLNRQKSSFVGSDSNYIATNDLF